MTHTILIDFLINISDISTLIYFKINLSINILKFLTILILQVEIHRCVAICNISREYIYY